MKYVFFVFLLLITCSSLALDYHIYAPKIQSINFHSQVVAQGKILERRSIAPYLNLGDSNLKYRYNVKFLITHVFKGQPSLEGKTVSFSAYLYPVSFFYYKPGLELVLAFAEVKRNLEATPLLYDLRNTKIDIDEIKEFYSLSANKLSQLEIWPIEYLIKDDFLISELNYSSEEIILGYFTKKTLYPKRGKNLKEPLAFDYDGNSDRYFVRDFNVIRVLKGNKYFEGKVMKFISYPIINNLRGYKIFTEDCGSYLKPNRLYLYSLKNINMIDSSIDNSYSRIRGYNKCRTNFLEIDPSLEPLIQMYLKKMMSKGFVPPPKPEIIFK